MRKNNKSHLQNTRKIKEELHKKFEADQTVDEIPLEDLKIDQKQERKEPKSKSQNTSSSERKYAGNKKE